MKLAGSTGGALGCSSIELRDLCCHRIELREVWLFLQYGRGKGGVVGTNSGDIDWAALRNERGLAK